MNILKKVALIIVVLLLSAGYTLAQDERIVFPNGSITIKQAFDAIQSQSMYLIAIEQPDFDATKKIRFTRGQHSIQDAMTKLTEELNKSYSIQGRYIIITDRAAASIQLETSSSSPLYQFPSTAFLNADSLERKLREPRINFPVNAPPEPEFNNFGYYTDRQHAGIVSGTPAYKSSLPLIAVRINLLYGALALAPNLGGEIRMFPKSSMLVSGSYNGWNRDGLQDNNKKITHWIAEAEYRYWLCEVFNGHFIGAHGFYGRFNISGVSIPLLLESGSENYRYDGTAFGGGISYGFQVLLGKRWNLELNAGLGAAITTYDKSECFRCGDIIEKDVKKTIFAPTKLGVTLVYIIK